MRVDVIDLMLSSPTGCNELTIASRVLGSVDEPSGYGLFNE